MARFLLEFERHRAARETNLEGLEIDLGLAGPHERADLLARQPDGEQADLRAVGEEDVGEAFRDDRLEAVVLQRPRRVLARGPAAEVGPRDEDRVRRKVPAGLLRPVVEEEAPEARPLDPLEELLRDDLVRVHVGPVEHADRALDGADGLHQAQARMSTNRPSMAAAAAICGETRGVRPPRPCRPSKLRLEVDAQRSPDARMSGFIPRHIEQPALRQSKPAARKTSSRPSDSACMATCWEPGTTIALTVLATLRPLTTSAAARRSPMREFVHEPMNTRSRRISWNGVPGSRPMERMARSPPSE